MPVLSDRDVIDQIISGHYADPFALLGMHATDNGLQVRALLPDATEVWLIEQQTGRRLAQLNCDDPRGFFSAVVPRRKILSAISCRSAGAITNRRSTIPTGSARCCRTSTAGCWPRARTCAPMNAWGLTSPRWMASTASALPFGRLTPSASRWWGVQLLGRPPPSDASAA